LFEHLVTLTFEKLAGGEDAGFIIIERYASDAGRRAVFDDVIHAPLVVLFARLKYPARPDPKPFLHPSQGATQGAGMGKRPEIPVPIFHLQTAQLKSRD